MTSTTDPERQRRIRVLLVAGMAVSVIGLLAVLFAGPLKGKDLLGAAPPPALARSTMQVQIVDPNGRPIPDAEVFLLAASNDAPAEAAWQPDTGTLTLSAPAGAPAAPRSVRITARGHRTREVQGIVRDQKVVLQRGLVTRMALKGVPKTGIPKHIRILLRIKPAGADPSTAGAAETINLMDNLGGPRSGPRNIPRGGFGYAVSLAQAQAGVILPEPGAYDVHWGLIDTRADTWFSLGASCGRRIQVRDTGETETFILAMTLDDLQKTLEGLTRGVRRVGR